MMQEFVQSIKDSVDRGIRGIHTLFPGTVISFDAAKGLAVVQPSMIFKTPGGKTMQYPQITGVPVLFPQTYGQKATIAYPVKPGDGCLILIAEQSIDYWLYGQETPTDLAFDLTNAICIPGLFATANSVAKEATENNSVIVDVEGTRLKVQQGKVQVDSAEIVINGNITVKGNIRATGTADIEGNTSVIGNFTTSGGIVNLN